MFKTSSIGVAILWLAALYAIATTHDVRADIIWIGGNNDWIDGQGNHLWNPADEPDPDDVANFGTSNSVNMGSGNTIAGLTMSGGIDLLTNGHTLNVGGLVELTGTSTNLVVGGAGSVLNTEHLTVNSGAAVQLAGGSVSVIRAGLNALGVVRVNPGGTVTGNGSIMLDAAPALITMFNNNGTLTAASAAPSIFLPPPPGILTINGGNAGTRIDLDGTQEAGVVNILRNQILALNVELQDTFNGTLNMFQNATLDFQYPWSLGTGGSINIDNGATQGFPPVPAGKAFITGGTLSQTGGSITVMDTDGELEFHAPFAMMGGTLANHGRITFNANASIVIPTFDFDAGNWTVQNSAHLVVDVGDYDPGTADKKFSSEITLNNGKITFNTGSPEFVMNGKLNMISNGPGNITVWHGGPIDIGDDKGLLDANAQLHVGGNSLSRFNAQVDFNADAEVYVAGGATLEFNSPVNFETVSISSQAQFHGAGTMRFNSAVNVLEDVTLSMVGGTVDLDGVDQTGDQIHVQAPMTIKAANLADFGRSNSGGGVNVIHVDALTAGANGKLTVQLDDPNAAWTINPHGVLALTNTSLPATMLSGSDLQMNGSLNITGHVASSAKLDIGGTVNIVTPAASGGAFVLLGRDLATPNRLMGGQINGPGKLRASDNRALAGYGTINAPIAFEGTAELIAEGGQLNVNGVIEDVGTIRVAGPAGVLNLAQPLSTNVTDNGIVLSGGTMFGATITTANANSTQRAVRGFGTVMNPMSNNGVLEANGGTLHFTNSQSDWDGSGNSGQLRAVNGGTLVATGNAPFNFGGLVVAVENSKVQTHGFGLQFQPSSSLLLTQGAFESTHATAIRGTVVVGPGQPSTIKVSQNSLLQFLTGSSTTLHGSLRLDANSTVVAEGATFSGNGALVIPAGRQLVMETNSNVNVLIENEGFIHPGQVGGIGRVDMKDYQQLGTGKLVVDLLGTALNQYDRLVVSGTAVVDGLLEVNLIGGFVPSLGNTFNVISAGGGIAGTFDAIIQPLGMPSGLSFSLQTQGTQAQLVVVDTPLIPGDFNQDGLWNCLDINALTQAIATSSGNLIFDMNGDGMLSLSDVTAPNVGWLSVAGLQNAVVTGGHAYLSGDANLDGVVDGGDFGVWNANKFTSAMGWCSGNFNADGVVDGGDFGIWNANKFQSSNSVRPVPEPLPGIMTTILGVILYWQSTRRISIEEPATRRFVG